MVNGQRGRAVNLEEPRAHVRVHEVVEAEQLKGAVWQRAERLGLALEVWERSAKDRRRAAGDVAPERTEGVGA